MKTEKVKFTPETKQSIIGEWEGNGWFLIEEQLHKDGNWLVFADQLPANESSVEDRLRDLEKRMKNLEKK